MDKVSVSIESIAFPRRNIWRQIASPRDFVMVIHQAVSDQFQMQVLGQVETSFSALLLLFGGHVEVYRREDLCQTDDFLGLTRTVVALRGPFAVALTPDIPALTPPQTLTRYIYAEWRDGRTCALPLTFYVEAGQRGRIWCDEKEIVEERVPVPQQGLFAFSDDSLLQ